MTTEFYSKVIIVTGSTGGIGAQIARDFAKAGAQVIVTGRRLDAIERVVNECNNLSPDDCTSALGLPADVTKLEEVRNLVGTVLERCGRIDVLVNCVGGGTFDGIHDDKLVEKIDKMMEINLRSAVAFSQATFQHLEQRRGCIINIVSKYATRPVKGAIAYSLSKASLLMFTRCIALELGSKGIRVNSVSPSSVHTSFVRSALSGTNTSAAQVDNFIAELEDKLPLRGVTAVKDVSEAVLFLASDNASFITGQDIAVDGGESLL